jgi:hypothetical protein
MPIPDYQSLMLPILTVIRRFDALEQLLARPETTLEDVRRTIGLVEAVGTPTLRLDNNR